MFLHHLQEKRRFSQLVTGATAQQETNPFHICSPNPLLSPSNHTIPPLITSTSAWSSCSSCQSAHVPRDTFQWPMAHPHWMSCHIQHIPHSLVDPTIPFSSSFSSSPPPVPQIFPFVVSSPKSNSVQMPSHDCILASHPTDTVVSTSSSRSDTTPSHHILSCTEFQAS